MLAHTAGVETDIGIVREGEKCFSPIYIQHLDIDIQCLPNKLIYGNLKPIQTVSFLSFFLYQTV